MKKSILTTVFVFCLAGLIPLFAASYDNNEFQRKSRAFTVLAERAYDDGAYDDAVLYAREAEKNADLSAAFIEKMIARAETETLLFTAHTRLSWAKGINAEKYFPAAVVDASAALAAGDDLFAAEEYADAKTYAQKALDALALVREVIPLPATYVVTTWESAKECFWNIAANPAVYGDPFKWEELYKANRKALVNPSDPDLVQPGMIVTIPSIQGEYREGTYDPSIKYDSFKSQVK